MRSCVTRVEAADGRAVTTIEGLATGDVLHPVQEAFLEVEAFQCGYCTPGMVMATVALLRTQSAPSDADIARATRPPRVPLRRVSAPPEGRQARCSTSARRHAGLGGRRHSDVCAVADQAVEVERYELTESRRRTSSTVERRQFLADLGVRQRPARRRPCTRVQSQESATRAAGSRSAPTDVMPGCMSTQTAASPATRARSRSGRTSARRSRRPSLTNCVCRSSRVAGDGRHGLDAVRSTGRSGRRPRRGWRRAGTAAATARELLIDTRGRALGMVARRTLTAVPGA